MPDPQTTEADRRKSVERAIANSRIEGLLPPDDKEQAILDAYIRGEIAPENLVDVIKNRMGLK